MNFDAANCVVDENSSIKDALKKVDKNHNGFVFTCDEVEKITGLATDGDIRRSLLKGATLDDKVLLSANRDFVRENTHATRENLIKKLKRYGLHSKTILPIKEMLCKVTDEASICEFTLLDFYIKQIALENQLVFLLTDNRANSFIITKEHLVK